MSPGGERRRSAGALPFNAGVGAQLDDDADGWQHAPFELDGADAAVSVVQHPAELSVLQHPACFASPPCAGTRRGRWIVAKDTGTLNASANPAWISSAVSHVVPKGAGLWSRLRTCEPVVRDVPNDDNPLLRFLALEIARASLNERRSGGGDVETLAGEDVVDRDSVGAGVSARSEAQGKEKLTESNKRGRSVRAGPRADADNSGYRGSRRRTCCQRGRRPVRLTSRCAPGACGRPRRRRGGARRGTAARSDVS